MRKFKSQSEVAFFETVIQNDGGEAYSISSIMTICQQGS